LDRLKAALRREPPPAHRPGAKERAMTRAMAAFEEKNAHVSQGSGIGDRLRGAARAAFETLVGRRSMKLTPAFAGGASLAVLVLAVMSASYVQTTLKAPVSAPQVAPPSASKQDGTVQRDAAKKNGAGGPAAKTASEQKRQEASVRKAERERAVAEPAPLLTAPAPAERKLMAKRGVGLTQAPGVAYDVSGLRSSRGIGGAMPSDQRPTGIYETQGRDRFERVAPNPVKLVSEDPVSTFSIDVDTASYAFMRAALNNNVLPQKDAVRVEELINYFPYDYERPADKAMPFKANLALFPSPWAKGKKLLRIGIAGYELKRDEKPRSNLVFLLDTSGSMNAANKLPLLINSMKLLLGSLKPDDTVAIVTYAGNAGTALEPTPVKDKAKILHALDNLRAHGSTAGAEGIRQAYELARQGLDKDGVNRVILATDGDFNVGITDREELKSYIERQRKTGISLSVLGFGRGNYNDALMQTLAQNGNGNAAYIDTLNEARKVLVEEAGSTLFTIASDVKLQVEFNPRAVAEYRLIGYETRLLNREDFNNDKVDAGDIGAGHTVTALYEITPAGSGERLVDGLRYGTGQSKPAAGGRSDEYAFLKIRYKLPGEKASKLITAPVTRAVERGSIEAAPANARFATAVAAFGLILKGGRYTGSYSYDDVIALAQGAKGNDPFGYRAEFINLVRLAKSAAALEPLSRR
jgi:Ca-activated chloride channel family protein